jgi:hypothetical protein
LGGTALEGGEVGWIERKSKSEIVMVFPANGQPQTIAQTDVKERKIALSAMPENLSKGLSKCDHRDLVAHLESSNGWLDRIRNAKSVD